MLECASGGEKCGYSGLTPEHEQGLSFSFVLAVLSLKRSPVGARDVDWNKACSGGGEMNDTRGGLTTTAVVVVGVVGACRSTKKGGGVEM